MISECGCGAGGTFLYSGPWHKPDCEWYVEIPPAPTACPCFDEPPSLPDFGIDLTPELRAKITVRLNGHDVTNNCTEGRTGPNGWVRVYHRERGKKHICAFGTPTDPHVASFIRTGYVEVKK